MSVNGIDPNLPEPIAYAQAVNDQKVAYKRDLSQAKLFKDALESEGQVVEKLIGSATEDGRRLLAKA